MQDQKGTFCNAFIQNHHVQYKCTLDMNNRLGKYSTMRCTLGKIQNSNIQSECAVGH